jgi:hypothetical protein
MNGCDIPDQHDHQRYSIGQDILNQMTPTSPQWRPRVTNATFSKLSRLADAPRCQLG